ncbi:hypothetical protein MauCBS54593_006907 [Microsporum audouinii]
MFQSATITDVHQWKGFAAEDENIGRVLPIIDLASLEETVSPSALIIFSFFCRMMQNLGRAIQLNCHHPYIECVDLQLDKQTLVIMANAALHDRRLISKLSVYLTTLEQAYHWPRDIQRTTPPNIEEHKLVFQVLLHEELHHFLKEDLHNLDDMSVVSEFAIDRALRLSRDIIHGSMVFSSKAAPGGHYKFQDTVNLLYRTSRGDWYDQSHYQDDESHLEFGRLHETTHTNGTQRRLQELFEASGALLTLKQLPGALLWLPSTSSEVSVALGTLQCAVAACREELYSMMFDEVIWGKTFARFSKGVGASDIGGGGADTPLFRMLDVLCGMENEDSTAALLEELDFRSRFFPPNIRTMIKMLAKAPSLRMCVARAGMPDGLKQAFNGLQQAYYDIYKMHRKKAMRILLSLSAGQLSTSSGTERAGSPERHIMSSLSKAMEVRFGKKPEKYMIDAICITQPLFEGATSCSLGARVIVQFATPLVVLPGDAISLAVNIEKEKWETRTYTVTSIVESETLAPKEEYSFPLAKAVEICVRTTGRNVSSYICSQQEQFAAKASILPSPHFRLSPNTRNEGHIFMLGQGGAIGVFATWLKDQKASVGTYDVVIGVRNPREIPFKQELCQIGSRLNVRVTVATPNLSFNDGQFIISLGLVPFSGRVDAYIRQLDQFDGTCIYICGSAAFGVSTLAAISEHQEQSAGISELSPIRSPIVTSRAPTVKLHVSSTGNSVQVNKSGLRAITKAELALHNAPGDAWMAVGDMVYDVTPFLKFHPGGEKVMLHVSGRQAKELMDLIHGDSFEVQAILARFLIGYLTPTPTLTPSSTDIGKWEMRLDALVQLQNDLINGSRFEVWPEPTMARPSECPPAYVISTSISQFVSLWCRWAEETVSCQATFNAERYEAKKESVSAKVAYVLEQATSLTDTADLYLRQTFDVSFQSPAECLRALSLTFNIYAQVAASAQDGLQELKASLGVCMAAGVEDSKYHEKVLRFASRLEGVLGEAAVEFRKIDQP